MIEAGKRKQADELRRSIALLEWDLAHIKNSSIKRIKEQKLRAYRNELRNLYAGQASGVLLAGCCGEAKPMKTNECAEKN